MIAAPLALALATAPLGAAELAWQWPVEAGGAGAMYRIDLEPAVYARITRRDLGDLVALNAEGAEIPFGPVPGAEPTRIVPAPIRSEVAWFALPRAPERAGADTIELHIQRVADGRLRTLDTRIAADPEPAATDLLLDLGRDRSAVSAVVIALAEDGQDLRLSVDVYVSEDLARWHRIASGLPLMRLRQGDFRIEKLTLELAATRAPYLLLSPSGAVPLAPQGVSVVRRFDVEYSASAPARQAVNASLVGEPTEAGRFEYRAPGPIPVDRIAVATVTANAVARVVVESRVGAGQPWRERARALAFRVVDDTGEVANGALDVESTRDRQWRVTSTPPLAHAPELRFEYRPDSFVLLAQGAPPYRNAAGSATRSRTAWPIADLLAPVRAQRGARWQPPLARLGPGSALAGAAALRTPEPPLPWRQWALWAVLVGAALAIVLMVVRLVRTTPS